MEETIRDLLTRVADHTGLLSRTHSPLPEPSNSRIKGNVEENNHELSVAKFSGLSRVLSLTPE